VVSETIDPKLLTPELGIDMVIPLRVVNQRFMRIVKQMSPFGPGNMTPVFMSQNVRDTGYGKCVGEEKTHLRLTAVQADSDQIVGIGFNMGDKYHLIQDGKPFDIAFNVDENHWNGQVSVQLKLKDLKASYG
jgi:single-stranded-DNA-specific exonuclease